jgi:hypothetical protein
MIVTGAATSEGPPRYVRSAGFGTTSLMRSPSSPKFFDLGRHRDRRGVLRVALLDRHHAVIGLWVHGALTLRRGKDPPIVIAASAWCEERMRQIVPLTASRGVVLNWSERRASAARSLSVKLFRSHAFFGPPPFDIERAFPSSSYFAGSTGSVSIDSLTEGSAMTRRLHPCWMPRRVVRAAVYGPQRRSRQCSFNSRKPLSGSRLLGITLQGRASAVQGGPDHRV